MANSSGTNVAAPTVSYTAGSVIGGLLAFCAFILIVVVASSQALIGKTSNVHPLFWLILGFAAFGLIVAAIISASLLLRVFGLHDTKHSFALPKNSVRGLLTFLVFVFLMVFIFFSVSIVSTAAAGTPVVQYIDKVLVALISIASSIIAFYFGSRSSQSAEPGARSPDAPQPTAIGPSSNETGDGSDGVDWNLSVKELVLVQRDGRLLGTANISGVDLPDDEEFAANFDPLPVDVNQERPNQPLVDAAVSVERSGEVLTISIDGKFKNDFETQTKDHGPPLLSLYIKDEEERAQSLEVKLG